MKQKTGGFTLIELLVVIAIIGILSSIVMSDLSSAKLRAANASIKASLKSIEPAAQVIYNDTGLYNTVCANPDIRAAYESAGIVGGGTASCNNSATKWATAAPLKVAEQGNAYWCVDYTGASKAIPDALSGNVCP